VQVGSNGGEGYCVNVPWSCGGVGDKDYIFAFQHVVLPIGTESFYFSPFEFVQFCLDVLINVLA